MTYPYIGKGKRTGCVSVFSKPGFAKVIANASDDYLSNGYLDGFCEHSYKNITREYLANTKIRILSPEHSEFVQKLAFSAGYEWYGRYEGGCKVSHTAMQFLYIYDDGIITCDFSENWFVNHDHKEIKIPMPPTESKEEDMKNNGDNLIFAGGSLKESRMTCEQLRKEIGCDDSLLNDGCEQWPCVLDKALCSFSKQECEVISTCGEFAWVSFKGRDAPETRHISQLSKPKTPEEKLRDELLEEFCTAGYEIEKYIDILLSKYITKKPQ